MPKFYWKTTGTRTAGTVVQFPPAVFLLIIISIAVGITMLLTGKVSKQEAEYKRTEAEYERLKQ